MSQLTNMLFVEGRGDGGLPSLTGISIFPAFLREMLKIMDRGIVLNMVQRQPPPSCIQWSLRDMSLFARLTARSRSFAVTLPPGVELHFWRAGCACALGQVQVPAHAVRVRQLRASLLAAPAPKHPDARPRPPARATHVRASPLTPPPTPKALLRGSHNHDGGAHRKQHFFVGLLIREIASTVDEPKSLRAQVPEFPAVASAKME